MTREDKARHAAAVDMSILSAIAAGVTTFGAIFSRVTDMVGEDLRQLVWASHSISSSADRVIDRRLQSLRRAGFIRYVNQATGWAAVKDKPPS